MNKFITFEGCEGCGKTTQSKLLSDSMLKNGNKVGLTREPGGTKEAEKLREILKDTNFNWHYRSEILLYMAARNEHLQDYILPKLRDDHFVISDRYIDSNIAYQAYGMGAKITNIEDIYEIIAGDFMPSLTFVIDITVDEVFKRTQLRNEKQDKYDSMDKNFHHEVREGFLEIARNNQKRCVVIDGLDSIEEIHKKIIAHVKDFYELENLTSIFQSIKL